MRPPAWYLLLVGLTGAQRLRELMRSRCNQRRTSGVPAAPRTFPVMVALHVGLFLLPPLEVALTRRRARRPALWVGLLGAATALRWWSIHELGPSWNVRAVVPSDLRPVTSGPYRFIRHPNYLAVALEMWALPMAGGAWFSALAMSVLNALVLWPRIRAEERLLMAVPGYDESFRGKARFLPGVF